MDTYQIRGQMFVFSLGFKSDHPGEQCSTSFTCHGSGGRGDGAGATVPFFALSMSQPVANPSHNIRRAFPAFFLGEWSPSDTSELRKNGELANKVRDLIYWFSRDSTEI